jgi:GDPmannose 4,6-dehydratase
LKKALILGITGQDGSYFAEFLLTNAYEVFGTSRDAEMASLKNPERLKIRDRVKVESAA